MSKHDRVEITIGDYIIKKNSEVHTNTWNGNYMGGFRCIYIHSKDINTTYHGYRTLVFGINRDNELFSANLHSPQDFLDLLNNKDVMQEIYNTESLKKDFEIIVDTFSKFKQGAKQDD